MYPCTYDKNLEMTQPLVQDIRFFVLAPWWPNQVSDWTEIWSVSYSCLVVHVQSFWSIALSWFSKMAALQPYFELQSGRSLVET
jgi:hypothetical protein